jgi:hypothetical protein
MTPSPEIPFARSIAACIAAGWGVICAAMLYL